MFYKPFIPLTLLITLTLFTLIEIYPTMAQQLTISPLPRIPNPDYVKREANYILATQCTEKDITAGRCSQEAFGALNNVVVGDNGKWDYIVPRENAMAILGLILASEITKDAKYRNRAELVADYLVRVQNSSDGAWYNQYLNNKPNDQIENEKERKNALSKSPTQTAEVMIALYPSVPIIVRQLCPRN